MGLFAKLLGQQPKQNRELELAKTSPAIAARIKNILSIQKLDAMPRAAARAFQLASDPKANNADFIEVIESDEVLGAKIIRVANSVYFFRGTPANDIEKAVSAIGLNELRCLLSASMLKNLMRGKSEAREQVWANAIATGVCCRMLSGYTDDISDGEAFLAGLLHDVGKLVMIQRAPEHYRKVILRVGGGEYSFCEIEEEIFQTNHVEVGKWVAETWNFPALVVYAIANHHSPWPTNAKHRGKNTTLPMLVKVGDTIAHACGFGHPGAMRGFQRRAEAELAQAFLQIGISEDTKEAFIAKFTEQYQEELAMYEGQI